MHLILQLEFSVISLFAHKSRVKPHHFDVFPDVKISIDRMETGRLYDIPSRLVSAIVSKWKYTSRAIDYHLYNFR